MLTNRRLELFAELLQEPALETLLEALVQGGGNASIPELARALALAGKGRVFRRLVALARASEDELEAWEEDSGALETAHRKAARLPVTESVEALRGFFERLGTSLASFLASFGLGMKTQEAPEAEEASFSELRAASPSDGS